MPFTLQMRSVISGIVRTVPEALRQKIIGSPSEPTHFANAVHALLNRAPGDRLTCLSCGGVLKGYRMRVDWANHRSFIYGSYEPTVVSALAEHGRASQE